MLKKTVLVIAPIALALVGAAMAQHAREPDGQDASVYVVSYIEVAPSARDAADGLLHTFATVSRKDQGNARFEILQRIAPSNQFVIVAIWNNQSAYAAHVAAAPAHGFRQQIGPHLITPIDERVHAGLEVAPSISSSAPGAVYSITHVDVSPPRKDECAAALQTLANESRKEPGADRFEVFRQSGHPNHFTVVEIWKSQAAYEAHITAVHTRRFREQLAPMSGALYDERLYRAM
jgi:quinol monooxygenase YgiN